MKIVSKVTRLNLIGGRLCLDFTNTVGGREADTVSGELFENYSDLAIWGRHVKLIDDKKTRSLLRMAEKRPDEAQEVLHRAVSLREAIYRIFKSVMESRRPEKANVETLNRELIAARRHEQLVYTGNGFIWKWEDLDDALDFVLWAVVQSAAELLASEEFVRVRRCGGEKCGWLFLDTSRNHSRQWCDMRVCGNLAKVHRYRRRQKK
jgi:predicted RNA-binding Zn ribbon-like protein